VQPTHREAAPDTHRQPPLRQPVPRWIRAAEGITKWIGVVFLAGFVFEFGMNWKSVDAFVVRSMRGVTQVEIGEVRVDLAGVPADESGEHVEENGYWITNYRVQHGVELKSARLSGRGEGECLVLRALEPVDLTGGFVGDSHRLLKLGDRDLGLAAGEVLEVYTYAPDSTLCHASTDPANGLRCVVASTLDGGRLNDGILKSELGAEERLVLIGAANHLLLDMDYWPMTGRAPHAHKHKHNGSKHRTT